MNMILATILMSACLLGAGHAAEPVIGYRNNGSGAYPDANPPLEWSATKNVKWRWDAPVLGDSTASPIIVGNRLITLADPLTIVCLDKNTGQELWRRERHVDEAGKDTIEGRMQEAALRAARINELSLKTGQKGSDSVLGKVKTLQLLIKGSGEEEKVYFNMLVERLAAMEADGKAHAEAYRKELSDLQAVESVFSVRPGTILTAMTPACDGERIVAQFEPGLVVCYDLAGNRQWMYALVDDSGQPAQRPGGPGKSPVIATGKVLVTAGNLLHCLDLATGKRVWMNNRVSLGGSDGLVVGRNGDVDWFLHGSGLAGHVAKGEPTARVRLTEFHFPLAVSADRRTFYCGYGAIGFPSEPTGAPQFLWELKGDVLAQVWHGHHATAAPAVHGGVVYYLQADRGQLTALDAATGAVLRTRKLEPWGKWGYGTPDLSLAGGQLVYFFKNGESLVIDAGSDFSQPRRNLTLGPLESTDPVFEGRRMYVRTLRSLFCIEQSK